MNTDYLNYLESQHWYDLRMAALNKANRKCEVCKRGGLLNGHHLIYRTPLTDCTTDDIMAMCNRCHEKWHNWLRRKKKALWMFDRESTVLTLRKMAAKTVKPEKPKTTGNAPKKKTKRARRLQRAKNAPKFVKQRIERQHFGNGAMIDGVYRI